jgi:hypothetical protein
MSEVSSRVTYQDRPIGESERRETHLAPNTLCRINRICFVFWNEEVICLVGRMELFSG